jgi:hypothetical protein
MSGRRVPHNNPPRLSDGEVHPVKITYADGHVVEFVPRSNPKKTKAVKREEMKLLHKVTLLKNETPPDDDDGDDTEGGDEGGDEGTTTE